MTLTLPFTAQQAACEAFTCQAGGVAQAGIRLWVLNRQYYTVQIHPAQVLAAESVFFGKRASRKVVAAIVIVCMGVGLSTVTDTQVCA